MKAIVAMLAALVALGALFWFYTAPKAPAEMTEAEIAQIEAEAEQAINDRWAAYHDVLVAGDVEGMMDYWTPDIRLLEPGWDFGLSDIRALFTDFFESGGKGVSFQPETFDLFVHGDVAYHIGQYDEVLLFGGQERTLFQNHFFARWEKGDDGVWRISRYVAASRDAPAEG